MDPETIGHGDVDVLSVARAANPQWFEAVMLAAEIMATRRKKWSGQTGPFANFIRWAQMNQTRVEDTFMWALTLKLTRAQDSEAEDDSLLDNDIDKGNYAMLAAGWRLLSPVAKMSAMLELGPWVDMGVLGALGYGPHDEDLHDGPEN